MIAAAGLNAVGAMIAALAQSQLPDFSFRSDLLRSRSIAKFIGKLDGGGRLQRGHRHAGITEYPRTAYAFRVALHRWTRGPVNHVEMVPPRDKNG